MLAKLEHLRQNENKNVLDLQAWRAVFVCAQVNRPYLTELELGAVVVRFHRQATKPV